MLSIPHQSIGFSFSSDLSLLTLKGIGLQYVDDHSYSWDNRNRKDSHCIIQYCIDGEGAIEIDGIDHPLHKGDAFIIDIPGASHYHLPKHSSHWEFIYLEFSKECLPLLWKIHRTIGPVVHFTENSLIFDRIMEIYNMALRNDLKSYFENSRISYDLWMQITEYVMTSSAVEISKVDHAKAYIDQYYYRDDLNLDFVADCTGMSKYYLCKEFHKKYGVSPGKYLRELRISQACRLLMTNSEHTLQEIAEMVGYSNNNYFGKVFKAEKGISPDKYRKQSAKYDLVRAVYETPHIKNIFTP